MTITLDQEQNIILQQLLNKYIAEQEKQKNKEEDTIEKKGQNAQLVVNITRAKNVLIQLDNSLIL